MHNFATAMMRRLPAETAHRAAINGLRAGFGPIRRQDYGQVLRTQIAGLALPNPVGLAAGFDKDGEVPTQILAAGFGFAECGSVTPRPQIGNPKPRLFRLPEDMGVINRMGFNNKGLKQFKNNLIRAGGNGIIGANLGANKDSDDRAADYITGLEALWGHCRYFAINVSSPNTPGLRGLQSGDALDDLLSRIAAARLRLAGDAPPPPIFLKVAPDLDSGQIETISNLARTYEMSGLIVGNTTLDRPESLRGHHKAETGGLSGAPLFTKSTRILQEFYDAGQGVLPLIGAGGVVGGRDAYAKIRAGASAVQLYSAMVYRGPGLAADICRDLAAMLAADGFAHISEAVGTAHSPREI